MGRSLNPAEYAQALMGIDAQAKQSPVLDSILKIASIMESRDDKIKKFGRPEERSATEPLFAGARGFTPQQVQSSGVVQGPQNMVQPSMPAGTEGPAAAPFLMAPQQPAPSFRTEFVRPAVVGTEQLKAAADAGVLLNPDTPEGSAAIQSATNMPSAAFRKKPVAGEVDQAPVMVDAVDATLSGLPVGTVTTRDQLKQAMISNRTKMMADAQSGRQDKSQNFQAGQNSTSNALKLADDYRKDSGTFAAVRDAYNRVKTASTEPSAAGDISLIYSYMRMLDPTSTVREGEFATAQNAGSVPEKIQAQYNKILNGERLTENIRADFLNQSSKLYQTAHKQQEGMVKQYVEKAKKIGAEPSLVVTDYNSFNDAGAGTQKADQNGYVVGQQYKMKDGNMATYKGGGRFE